MPITWLAKTIYHSESGIEVKENPWYRWLTLGSPTIQTLISRKDPGLPIQRYIKAMSLPVRCESGPACMMGLGGAALAHYLYRLQPDLPLTVVEKSKEVIELAKTYFYCDSLNSLSIINAAAEDFIQNTEASYKHLLIDLYTNEGLPLACTNAEFINACFEHLEPSGFLTINLLNRDEQLAMTKIIQERFNKQTLVIPVRGYMNMILIAAKSGIDPFINQLEQQAFVKKLYWDPHWGRMLQAKE